jgi:hypothetical protein
VAIRTPLAAGPSRCSWSFWGSDRGGRSRGAPASARPARTARAYDALFRLPNDSGSQPAQGAAVDRKRWEDRFAAVRGDLDGAQAKLAKAQADLEALAHKSYSWQMDAQARRLPPRTHPSLLRQEIRQYREDVDAPSALRDFEGEPRGRTGEWREPHRRTPGLSSFVRLDPVRRAQRNTIGAPRTA